MDIEALAGRISGGRLFHSYIVTGADAEARERAGRLIARAAVCSGTGSIPCGRCRDCRKALQGVHPDITDVRRERDAREIGVDAMRSVRARASVLPNEAERSVYIIHEADLMNVQAQNAMLKIFEEPPAHAVFVLLAENPQRLLPTVESRCETVTLTPDRRETDGDETASALVSAFARGDNSALLRAVIPMEAMSRTQLPEFLDALRREAVGLAAQGGQGADMSLKLSDTLDRAERLLNVNVSAGHVAGLILAELVK